MGIKKLLSMIKGTILIVDDNKNIITALRILLAQRWERIITLSSTANLLSTISKEKIDVILLDMNFSAGINSGNEGIFWLNEIKRIDLNASVVLFTAYADIQLAVKGIKEGAFDFVVKPWDNTSLILTLEKAYKQHNCIGQNKLSECSMIYGNSKEMTDIRSLIERVAPTDANILITGENGTGKEVLAREIHRLSGRYKEDFVSVDMGSIPDTLFESELFGHIKGSFTDACSNRTGRLEDADGGTLFLDEIGNIPITLQAKLLTVIQNRKIARIGTNIFKDIDIRLICATNKDLFRMVNDGVFREDLLYRINTVHIELPPLRERINDIIPLAKIFLLKYSSFYKKEISTISDGATKLLLSHCWHGNIRELQHVIEKAVIMANSDTLNASDISISKIRSVSANAETIEAMEKNMIVTALNKYDSNLSLVANKLGISRQTLYNKMKRYEI